MIKNVLIDLDSTLLEMDQNEFVKCYLKGIGLKAYKEYGIDPKTFASNVMTSTYGMIKNNGIKTNEEVFFESFNKFYPGIDTYKLFMDYYMNEFDELESLINKTIYPKLLVDTLKSKGYRVVIATTPLFPKIAIEKRLKWAGLDYSSFEYVSTYEISHYAKPNQKYFEEILEKNNMLASESVMIGNDMLDDFSNLPSEMDRYLVLDYALNLDKKGDIKCFTLKDLCEMVKENTL